MRSTTLQPLLLLLHITALSLTTAAGAQEIRERGPQLTTPPNATQPPDIGSRLELFVDDTLIDHLAGGAALRLHHPTPREIVLVHDEPWEGTGSCFYDVFRDGDVFKLYYIGYQLTTEDGSALTSHGIYACYAESKDGIHWTKPDLGIVEYDGNTHNNIVWTRENADNFVVYKDANPNCRPGEEYKATASGPGGLWAYKSSDGLHWSPLKDGPIITKGAFDSQNLTFWDADRGHYWAYFRDFHDGLRDIRVATSEDYLTWSEPELLRYVDSPEEQLYTNQVMPYPRAPHIFVGFPTRYVERPWSPSFETLPDRAHRENRVKISPRYGTAITDGLFMTSRDGRLFNRWGEAFLRPGPERKDNWLYGDCYQGLGLIETQPEDPTAPREFSLYCPENTWKTNVRMRRYTMRIDGFVSINAPLKGGEVLTKPLLFSGSRLLLNFATSAAGSVRVELQDAEGAPLDGFSLADCDEVFGDSLERAVTWQGSADVGGLAGRPVRVRIVLSDADVYSLRFAE